MSNSTTLLDTISASQASKEVTANAMHDAASPAMLFGRRASTTSALTWGYYGGGMWVDGVLTAIANGTVALTGSTTNYVEATRAGVVSKNTTGFTAGSIPLYTIVTGVSTVTSYTDHRITNIPLTGRLSKSVAGSGSVTLTSAEAANQVLNFTGILTGNKTVVVPNGPQVWHVFNNTTGSFSLTIKTSAGTGIDVVQTKAVTLEADGTNVVTCNTDTAALGAQPLDATLTALAGLATGASKVPYSTGTDTFSQLTLDTDGTLAANSDTTLASQKAVKTYVDTAVTGLLDFKGATDCSSNPNYPAASKGDFYIVSVAGKIGGASGTTVEAGDGYYATADNAGGTEASVGTSWAHVEHNVILGTIATQNANAVAITGGAIDGTVIGGTTAAAITGTTITATTKFLAADGTAAAPGFAFTADPTMGVFRASANNLGFATRGVIGLNLTSGATPVNYWGLNAANTGSYPSLAAQGSDANVGMTIYTKGAVGYGFYTRTASALQASIEDTASSVNYPSLTGAATGNSPWVYASGSDTNVQFRFASKGTSPLIFRTRGTSGYTQFSVTDFNNAVNCLSVVGQATGASPGISAVGTDTNIGFGISSNGTSALTFYTQNYGAAQFRIGDTASAVNYIQTSGAVTTVGPYLAAIGTDTNIDTRIVAKGTGAVYFQTGGGSYSQLTVTNTTSSVNRVNVTGSTTGNAVTVSATGTDTNIDFRLQPKGTGVLDVYGTAATTAGVPAAFSAAEYLAIKVNGVTKYLPLATATW